MKNLIVICDDKGDLILINADHLITVFDSNHEGKKVSHIVLCAPGSDYYTLLVDLPAQHVIKIIKDRTI